MEYLSTFVSLYLPIKWLYLETDFSFKVPFFPFFFNNLTINKIEGQDNGTEVPN